MKKNYYLILVAQILLCQLAYSQNIHQTIRGEVIDAITGYPLIGANIILQNTNPPSGTVSDVNGQFELNGVPLGRQSLQISFLGYEPSTINNLLVSSGKEIILQIKLQESYHAVDEITVTAGAGKSGTKNEMAMISSRSFSVEETERFAGSLGDPARMVANYAGVMMNSDSRNDIIIRGNSPMGVLWRLEGIEIPNPNHFGAMGTTGGPVSMLNNNLLANSDFLTGAFPAEYGNATAGAFDLYMRSGNNTNTEFTGQIGFNGFEAGIEGPMMKREDKPTASYMANFRYSTLEVMNKMGFDFGTGAAIPQYKDFTFNVDLPGTRLGRFKLIGLYGDSFIALGHEEEDKEDNSYSGTGTTTDFGSELAVVGLTNSYFLNNKTGIKTRVSFQNTSAKAVLDSLKNDRTDVIPFIRNNDSESKLSFSTRFIHKPSNKNNYNLGFTIDHYLINYQDSVYKSEYNKFIADVNIKKQFSLLRAFGQWQHRFSNKITGYGGLHLQYFPFNEELALEPRASLEFKLNALNSFTLGYGRHSQLQPKSVYFFKEYNHQTNQYRTSNEDLKFTRSDHYVAAHNLQLSENFRIKTELYYQYLYNVPVKKDLPEFSMLNAGANFGTPLEADLINEGSGTNFGVEFTIEKFLSRGYYFLFTTSIFDSKYKGYSGTLRNTAFNSNYVFNLLGGYEFKVKQNNFITIDIKSVWAGGRRYIPIDLDKSQLAGSIKYDWDEAYKNKYDDYLRTDIRFGYKINKKKHSQEWAIDLQNVSNHQNIFGENYDSDKNETYLTYQQGFMPMFLYRIQF